MPSHLLLIVTLFFSNVIIAPLVRKKREILAPVHLDVGVSTSESENSSFFTTSLSRGAGCRTPLFMCRTFFRRRRQKSAAFFWEGVSEKKLQHFFFEGVGFAAGVFFFLACFPLKYVLPTAFLLRVQWSSFSAAFLANYVTF